MKENKDKESIQQHPSEGDNRGIKTPEPPQKKDPSKKAVSDEDMEEKSAGKRNKDA